MAAQMQGRGRQPRGSWRSALHFHPIAGRPMEESTDHQWDRTAPRGVQAPDQDPAVLPSAETAAMLFWALLAAGQITMRKVDGWQTLNQKLADKPIDLAA